MAKVLELQLQHQSFQSAFRIDFLWDWLVWSLRFPRDSQDSSPTPLFESISSGLSLVSCQLSHLYMTTGKTPTLTIQTFVGKVTSSLFNTLSTFVIALLPRSNCFLISWLQSPSTVILEPKKRKSATTSIYSSSICHEVMGQDAMIWVFLILSVKLAFSLSSFTFIKRLNIVYIIKVLNEKKLTYVGNESKDYNF